MTLFQLNFDTRRFHSSLTALRHVIIYFELFLTAKGLTPNDAGRKRRNRRTKN